MINRIINKILNLVVGPNKQNSPQDPPSANPESDQKVVSLEQLLGSPPEEPELRVIGLYSDVSDEKIAELTQAILYLNEVNRILPEGKKKKPIEKIANAVSNPVILEYLEADIIEMQKLTKGQPNYFRKRIRAALAEGPEIFRKKQTFNGESIEVLTFSIEPYAKDPLRFESGRSKYRRYSKKKYIFYLSENIPGHILGIDYEIPKRKKKGAVQEYYGKQQMRLE